MWRHTVSEMIQELTDLVLALPALIAAIGTVIVSIKAQQPDNVATRELASQAAPTGAMLARTAPLTPED